jgi:tripartite-type tricarboxylate transporter receptor subunit TctC
MRHLIPLLTAGLCGIGGVQAASAQAVAAPEYAVVVGAGSAYQTIGELVQVGRGAVAGLKCGAGRGTPGCESFARSVGAKVEAVSYKATGAVIYDLASSQLDFGVLTIEDAKVSIANGKVRALAVGAMAPRSPLPGTPTLAEAGYR